ncbi:hypothetical protein A9Q84_11195 [Halobacteriovorax marinus]|uniref:Porin domain-containing protein n=1 Tax=Halobacteriovorax marinus TaxID=97084 RepID=A0A1Y5F7Y9_9BACT|nr:hypothetical protein A9Q84_11195 [Halobacteriovorax marinus]
MKKITLTLLASTISLSAYGIDIKNFSLYGKVALVSTIDLEKGSQGLGDNSSRFGIKYKRDDIFKDWVVGLRGEWSISTNRNNSGFGTSNFNGKQFDVIANDGPFGNRLGYLWIKNGDFTMAAGKVWSVFYDIPSYTDIFQTDGARASSAYTATGEIDGTYRASEVIQARYKYENYHFGLQTKLTGKETVEYDFDSDGTADSTLVYKQVQAGSIQYITKALTLGVSAINLMFDNNGQSESQLSLSYGFKFNYKNYFLNSIYTRAKDLELNSSNNKFVHSDGIESVVGHNFQNNSTFMLGFNRQSRSESGDFKLLYYYASLSRKIKDLVVAAEYIHGDSTESDGSEAKEKKVKLTAMLYF